MQIRIYRTWSWQLDCPNSEVVMGGRNPMKLVAHDQLQYAENYGSVNVTWVPVPIVEEEKPAHPVNYMDAKRFEQSQKEFDRILEFFKNNKLPPTCDILTKED